MGHWKNCCRKLKRSSKTNETKPEQKRKPHYREKRKQIHEYVEQETSSEDDQCQIFDNLDDANIDTVTSGKAFTLLKVKPPRYKNKCNLKVKLDTGANANAMPLRTFRQMYGSTKTQDLLTPCSTRLTSYSGNNIDSIGVLGMYCRGKNKKWVKTKFHVVDVAGPILLGLPSCEELGMVSINCERLEVDNITDVSSIDQLKAKYPDQFDKIGCFKEPARLLLRDDAEPHIDRPRKCNINLLPKIKALCTKWKR